MMTTRRDLMTWGVAAAALGLVGCSSSGGESETASSAASDSATPIENLRVWTPTTLAFAAPMAAFGDGLKESGLVSEVTKQNWASVDALSSLLLNGEADMAATPTFVSANLHNKGADLDLAAVVVWGMLYVAGPAEYEGADDLSVLEGARVGVPPANNTQDLIFRYLLGQKGIAEDDLEIVNYSDTQELVNVFVTGQVDWAVLPEHVMTVALTRAANAGLSVGRDIDLQNVWAQVTGGEARFPMAGISVPSSTSGNIELFKAVLDELESSVATVNEAGDDICATIAEENDVEAGLVKQVIPRLQLEVVPAARAKDELLDYYERLATVNTEIMGGRVPDDAFFLADPRE